MKKISIAQGRELGLHKGLGSSTAKDSKPKEEEVVE